jgi:hypothetical protein
VKSESFAEPKSALGIKSTLGSFQNWLHFSDFQADRMPPTKFGSLSSRLSKGPICRSIKFLFDTIPVDNHNNLKIHRHITCLLAKKRFAKNLGQKIIQVKVNLGDYSYIVPTLTVNWDHGLDPHLEVSTGPDHPGINSAGG